MVHKWMSKHNKELWVTKVCNHIPLMRHSEKSSNAELLSLLVVGGFNWYPFYSARTTGLWIRVVSLSKPILLLLRSLERDPCLVVMSLWSNFARPLGPWGWSAGWSRLPEGEHHKYSGHHWAGFISPWIRCHRKETSPRFLTSGGWTSTGHIQDMDSEDGSPSENAVGIKALLSWWGIALLQPHLTHLPPEYRLRVIKT